MLRELKKTKGFTLIELLLVMGIIGILIISSVVAMQRYQKKAVDVRIQGDLAHVRNLAAMIYSDDVNYNALCDSGDTLNDSHPNFRSLQEIEDDVENFTGEKPICYSLGPDYCVQTILTIGGSFCVDAAGYIGEGETHCGEEAGFDVNRKCSAP